jgi:hypothetical protein
MPLRLACLLVAAAFAGGVSVAGSAIADDLPVFRLVARDGRFDPAVLEVPAGKRFRVEIVNENRKAIEFESRPLKQEKVIAGGGKATVTINAAAMAITASWKYSRASPDSAEAMPSMTSASASASAAPAATPPHR